MASHGSRSQSTRQKRRLCHVEPVCFLCWVWVLSRDFVRTRESFAQYNDTQLASDLLSSCTMNVVKPSRAVINSSLPKAAPSSKVNLYQEIPNLEVSLDDFEEFALDRLKVSGRFDCLPENMKPKKKQHTHTHKKKE